jgi:methionyl-tRNA synthetase
MGSAITWRELVGGFGTILVSRMVGRFIGVMADDDFNSDWSTEQAEKHLNEIRSLLGNFFLRITSRAIQSRLSSVPNPRPELSEISSSTYQPGNIIHQHNRQVLDTLEQLGSRVKSNLDDLEVAEALEQIVLCLKQVSILFRSAASFIYDSHLQANAAISSIKPWASDPIITHAAYLTSLETLRICGICLQPIIPSTSSRLLDALGVRSDERTWDFTEVGRGAVGDVTSVVLFERKTIENI